MSTEYFMKSNNPKNPNTGKFLFCLGPWHTLCLPSHFTHGTKALTNSLNQFFSCLNSGSTPMNSLSEKGRERKLSPNWPKYCMFSSWTGCLHSPSLTLQIPTSNPQGMIIDKNYFLNKLLKILMSMHNKLMLRYLGHNGENLEIFLRTKLCHSAPFLLTSFKSLL